MDNFCSQDLDQWRDEVREFTEGMLIRLHAIEVNAHPEDTRETAADTSSAEPGESKDERVPAEVTDESDRIQQLKLQLASRMKSGQPPG